MAPHEERRFDVVCFDLDGTVVPSTTVTVHLARWLDHESIAVDLERRYDCGELTNVEVAEAVARYYAGRSLDEVWHELRSVEVIEGLDELLDAVRGQGMTPLIATVAAKFAAEFFADRYGFAAASGCEMRIDERGRLTGEIAQHFEAEAKVDFVREWCAREGIGLDRCIAVGDGGSDLPLFDAVGFSIALNATPSARAAADVSVDTSDARDLIAVIAEASRP